MLLPLRPGHLLLPNVTVQSVGGADDATPEGPLTARPSSQLTQSTPLDGSRLDQTTNRTGLLTTTTTSAIRSETHNRSQNQMVLVLPDLQSTTVRLASSSDGPQVTLVDMDGRVDDAKEELPSSSWLWSTGIMEGSS